MLGPLEDALQKLARHGVTTFEPKDQVRHYPLVHADADGGLVANTALA